MRVIDSHVHIYERIGGYGSRGELRAVGKGLGRWANGDMHRLIPKGMGSTGFTAKSLVSMLTENGVEKAVVLQGNLYGFQNGYIRDAVRLYPDRLIGACAVDPFARQGQEVLKHQLDTEGFRAVKFEFSDNCGLMSFHRPFAIHGDVMQPYYRIIAERNATLVVDIGSAGMDSYQPEAVGDIAVQYRGMRIVVCHLLAHRCGEGDALAAELEKLSLPNVWFDLSAVPWNVAPDGYPFPVAIEYVNLAKRIVGDEKLLWGSDAPGVMINTPYRRLLDYLCDSDGLTQGEKENIFYQNALRAYDFRV